MVFNFNTRKQPVSNSLSEEDIRNRLYGSAVGISTDVLEKLPKKQKVAQEEIFESDKEFGQDRSKITGELATLKIELEQARRRLDRMKGVNTKKMRLIIISSVVLLLFILLTAAMTRKIFSYKTSQSKATTSVAKMSYAVQVAVSANLADAENLTSDLDAKGYKSFIQKSSYTSGKDKFIIYAGGFKDKKSAMETMARLKAREGLKDSFVINMPK